MRNGFHSAVSPPYIYLGGGFTEEVRSMLIAKESLMNVPALKSTQKDADTRVILHNLYSAPNDRVKRVVIHVNDTDIIISNSIMYAYTLVQHM